MSTLKDATIQDIPVIHRLAHQIWPAAFKDILSRKQIAYMLDWMYSPAALKGQMDSGHQFLLLSEQRRACGYCAYAHQGKNTKLHKIYVLPEVQGQGCGKILLSEVIDRARKNESSRVVLNVNRYNPAVVFYEKLGFVVVGTEDNPIGSGYYMNDYVMQLAL